MYAIVPVPWPSWVEKALSLGWRLFSKPRLNLYFDEKMTYHVASDLGFYGVKGMFVHVMVLNSGRKTAVKCMGFLCEVQIEASSGAFEQAAGFNNAVELHWAHEPLDCFAKDIPPDEPTRLDVCFAHEGQGVLHFFCDKRPRGVQTDFPPGRYRIKLKIRSEEGVTCSRHFLLSYDGNFRHLRMEMID